MTREPYELSIWEDVIVPAASEVPEYFTEKKVAVIGSHDFNAPLRAHDVTLKENINGEKTLTFNMLRKIKDDNGELIDNPLAKLLTNECKLKLRDGEAYSFTNIEDLDAEDTNECWYDFVIKNIDEDKNSFLNTYTAKELFVNELGKNGWAVTLDTELENNFGTIKELGARVLEGSDWTISDDSYSPTEKIAEPLFKTTLTAQLVGAYILSNTPITIPSGKIIYPLYNSVEWDNINSIWKFKDGEIQFLYADKEFTSDDADDNRIIIDNTLAFNIATINVPSVASITLTGANQTDALQGYRIVKTQDNHYEAILDQYVKDYEVNNVESGAAVGTKVYGYTRTDYITPTILPNLLTNSSNFSSVTGWSGDEAETRLYPLPTSGTPAEWINTRIFSYLSLDVSTTKGYLNEGPQFEKLALIKDNVYVLRMKARWILKNATEGLSNISTTNLATIQASIRKEGSTSDLSSVRTITTSSLDTTESMDVKGYPLADSGDRTPYTSGATSVYIDADQYIYVYLVATQTTNVKTENLRLHLTNTSNNATHDFCIEDIQLFDYREDEAGLPIFNGDTPYGIIKETPLFYQIVGDEAVSLSSNEAYYTPLFKTNYESVRSITVKESNYFNNIQNLAELFEVWVRFKTYHTKNGKLLFVDGLPKKEVIFSQFSPNGETVNQAGFKYGVNLQSIKRSLDSDSIATKVIVKENNQEYAVDGMASIRRAKSNPSGENEIYNFNYYINKGLLNYNQVLADLYGFTSTDLAFLVKLRGYNNEYNEKAALAISYGNECTLSEVDLVFYQVQIDSANDELTFQTNLMNSFIETDNNYKVAKLTAEQVTAKIQAYTLAKNATQSRYNAYKSLYDAAVIAKEAAKENNRLLKLQFYKKYYRFIQEGTWTDEKYVDDELYYLDALKVAEVSAFPKVSYSIGILDVSSVSNYESYAFEIGQRTYIEDPEFFGYVYKTVAGMGGNIKTPFRQEVIIAERSRNFDDASKSIITIQNYKNQFEELFQKITATTQTLQYQSGAFARAAAAVTPTGEIDISTLEKSFSNNAFILSNSNNQNVIWDSSLGIEIINNENSSERLRIVSGGIFLSTDAGKTWKSGITGTGINTRYLLAGQIDTSKITIVNGTIPYFRWDTDGITAFYVDEPIGSYDMTKYVRYNQYGIYGTTRGGDLQTAVDAAVTFDDKLEAIKEYSNFALTWDGMIFQMQEGAVSLTPLGGLEIFGEDIFSADAISSLQPIDSNGEPYIADDKIPLISLGRFYNSLNDYHYGLRMRDKTGYITLSTDINGEFWVQKKFYVGQKDAILAMADEAPKVAGFIGDTVSANDYTTIIKPILDELGLPSTLPIDPTQLQQFYQEHSIRLWAGSAASEIYSAPFFVLEDGTLYAQNGLFKGTIHARGGSFEGLLTIGANDKNGINGLSNADIVMWAGKTFDGELTSYNFSIDKDGLLFARNATIGGTINVDSGSVKELLIPDWHSGITSQGDVLFWINSTSMGNPTTAAFYITQVGSAYTSKLFLRDGLYINPSENESYYQIGFNDDQLAMWAGAINADYSGHTNLTNAAPFRVTYAGEVYAQYLNLGNGSLVANDAWLTGKLSLKQHEDLESIILDSSEGIRTSTFNTVQGWKISTNGDAVFNNVNIRGELTSATFSYQSKNIMGGDLLLAPTYYHSGANTNFTYNSQSGNMFFTLQMVVDSSIYAQSFWPTESTIESPIYGDIQVNLALNIIETGDTRKVPLEGLDGTVTRIGTNTLKIDLTCPMALLGISDLTSTQIELLPGISIASLGECGITLNASHPYGPAIVITDISQTNVIITQLGRLEGVIDPFFNELHGYGLYAQNAYLTGKLFLPNAGITDGNSDLKNGQAIRMWAGTSPENKTNAPFIVTQDGSVYASKGVFSGTVNATDSTFSGYLQTAGILIGNEGEDFDTFYVAYANETATGFPRIEDLILQIDKTGLNIWEGGLRAYSDYASGWRNGVLPPTPTIDSVYGYHGSLADTNPFPYFSLIDDEGMRAYVAGLHVGKFELEGSSLFSKSVKISDGEITFIQRSAADNDFLTAESVLYNSTANIWKVGMTDGNLSINSDRALNKFTIANGNNNNLVLTLTGLLDITGDAEISDTLKIGEHTIIKPYVSSSGENYNGLDFMI